MKGNVAFSSATAGWSFTLQSFAQLYADVYGVAIDARELVSLCNCKSSHAHLLCNCKVMDRTAVGSRISIQGIYRPLVCCSMLYCVL